MPSERVALERVVESVADGTADIDWDAIEANLQSARDRQLLRQLRILARISDVHRSQPDADTDAEPPVGLEPASVLLPDGEESVSKVIGRIEPQTLPPMPVAAGDGPVPPGDLPTRWGHLEIRERVGQGTFGEVFRAFDTQLHREVALKLLRAGSSAARLDERVLREGRILARLRHPNVVGVYGAESREGRVGLWMEFIRGATLEERLRQQGPFGAREAALIGQELCRAVAAVHAAGLVHRDIKAQNVMREKGGRVVLMDFGAGQYRAESARGTVRLTGTPLYLAPEVLNGGEATPASDIYSIGVLLYRLVTNDFPVKAATLEDLKVAHRDGRATRLHDVRPDLPDGFVRAVESLLHRVPEQRPRSAGAALERLDLKPEPVAARSLASALDQRTLSRAPWRTWVASALAVVVIAGGTTAYLLHGALAPTVRHVLVAPLVDTSGSEGVGTLAARLVPVEVSARLGRVGALRVVPASFVNDRLARGATIDQIAAQSGADAILEGTTAVVPTSEAGGPRRVRVSLRLFRTDNRTQLWTSTMERPLGELVQVSAEMALALVNGLKVSLQRRESDLLALAGRADDAAMEPYLQGREAAEQRTAAALRLAIAAFQTATARDPSFAEAHVQLAEAYLVLPNYDSTADLSNLYRRALAAADEAVRLNPRLADAFATRAFAHYTLGWQWDAADRDFRKALEIDPASGRAHHWYADYLSATGRPDEAITHAWEAHTRAPFLVSYSRDVAWQYFYARRYSDAITHLRSLLAEHPDAVSVHTLLGRVLVVAGTTDEGIDHLVRAVQLAKTASGRADRPVWEEGLLAIGYAFAGQRERAVALLAPASAAGYAGPMNFAHVAAALGVLGEWDSAFEALERAVVMREPALVGLKTDPIFDSLRGDRRYAVVLDRMGLQNEVASTVASR